MEPLGQIQNPAPASQEMRLERTMKAVAALVWAMLIGAFFLDCNGRDASSSVAIGAHVTMWMTIDVMMLFGLKAFVWNGPVGWPQRTLVCCGALVVVDEGCF